MSEFLMNKEEKQQKLKEIIKGLHSGKDPNQVKDEFKNLIKNVDASEIASMEQALIKEGMQPEEITKLCDVHAAVFRDTLEQNEKPQLIPGHPLYTMKHENEEINRVLSELGQAIEKLKASPDSTQLSALSKNLSNFRENLDRHYSKKENILFPYLEKHGITGPPSVMWSVDDEIRDMVKSLSARVNGETQDIEEINKSFNVLRDKINEMIFKEENILTPMSLEHLSDQEWVEVKEQDEELGIVFSRPHGDFWQPKGGSEPKEARLGISHESIPLDTGYLTPIQINEILTNIPIDITFVDENDVVRYFSQGRERIFTRTKSIIGRKVQNCHPPESVHMVEQILADFKSGRQNTAEFWLVFNGAFVHIRYFALRGKNGEYRGTMEVSQDVTKIRALEGERRLLQYQS